MADYISCIEASGANQQRVATEVNNAQAGEFSAGVKGSGSGVVAKGSGSLVVDKSAEQALAKKFEQTWFSNAMVECRKVLVPEKSRGGSNGAVKSEPGTNKAPPSANPQESPKAEVPDLRWNVNGITLGAIGPRGQVDISSSERETILLMAGQITNAGTLPSITRNWTLSVLLPDETEERIAELLVFRGKNRSLDFGELDGSNNVRRFGQMPLDSAYLPEITTLNPIPAGGSSIAGVAIFKLNVPVKRVVSGTLITMQFEDVRGKQCGIVKYPYLGGSEPNPFWLSPGTPH